MSIGAFSLSLNVKDIKESKNFYEKIGFTTMGGNEDEKWLIMKNEDCVIGLFQGMFDKNMLTFNPGWDSKANEVDPFTDVRKLQEEYKEKGVKILSEVDTESNGPGHIMIEDPDGNPILIDQHR